MLKFRLPLGLAFIGLVVLCVWIDGVIDRMPAPGWWPPGLVGVDGTLPPSVVVVPVLGVLGVLVARELARILRDKGVEAPAVLTCGLALVGLAVTALSPDGATGFTGVTTAHTALGLALVGSMVAYARRKQTEGLVAAAGGALLAYAYIGVLLGFWSAIRREHSEWVLLWVLLTTKSSDIGAYFAGRFLGRNKLAPWLSPGKTWEGFWGGVALSSTVGGIGAWWLASSGTENIPIWAGVVVGGVFAVVGQAGDLVASLLKRDAGRKDAGASVPGFGGVLDVVDSLLLVGPVAFWALRAIGGN
ncbi:MAG: phosphatidate cytidylyltransferase [Planctomycetota bacterium]